MAASAERIEHDTRGHRFCVKLEGYEACLMYRLSGTELDLYHTYVPEVFRGRGLAEQLVKAGFEYAKAHSLAVIPSCSYISGAYLKRHPEYEPFTRRGGRSPANGGNSPAASGGPASTPIVSG